MKISGGHSTIHMYKDKAVKVLDKYSSEFSSNIFREINFLKTLDHPNIIKLRKIRCTRRTVRLTMDRYKYCLRDYAHKLSRKKRLAMLDELFLPLFSAIIYLNKMHILHADINLRNIVYTPGKAPMLIDFSSSMFNFSPETVILTVQKYRAPEMKENKICATTDLYMLAAAAYNWFSKRRYHLPGDKYFPDAPGSAIMKILPRILLDDPTKRMTIDEVAFELGFSPIPQKNLIPLEKKHISDIKLKYIRKRVLDHRGFELSDLESAAQTLSETGEDPLICFVLAQSIFGAEYYSVFHLCFLNKIDYRILFDKVLNLFARKDYKIKYFV